MILNINYSHQVITLIDGLVANTTTEQWQDEDYLSNGNFMQGNLHCDLEGLKMFTEGLKEYAAQIKKQTAKVIEELSGNCKTSSMSTGLLYSMDGGVEFNKLVDRIITLTDYTESIIGGHFDNVGDDTLLIRDCLIRGMRVAKFLEKNAKDLNDTSIAIALCTAESMDLSNYYNTDNLPDEFKTDSTEGYNTFMV